MRKINEIGTDIIEGVLIAALASSIFSIMGALIIIIYQVFIWLKFDYWEPISVITLLIWLKISWAVYPTNWLGLYKLLDWCPLSLAFIVPCIMLLLLSRIAEAFDNP